NRAPAPPPPGPSARAETPGSAHDPAPKVSFSMITAPDCPCFLRPSLFSSCGRPLPSRNGDATRTERWTARPSLPVGGNGCFARGRTRSLRDDDATAPVALRLAHGGRAPWWCHGGPLALPANESTGAGGEGERHRDQPPQSHAGPG